MKHLFMVAMFTLFFNANLLAKCPAGPNIFMRSTTDFETHLVENESGKAFLGSPKLSITVKMDNDYLTFDAFAQMEKDNEFYIFGNCGKQVKALRLSKDTLVLYQSTNRAMNVENIKIDLKLIEQVRTLPCVLNF